MTIQVWHPLDKPRTMTEAKPPTSAQVARRRSNALTLCQNALNATSWRLADRMARAWLNCGCSELGVNIPKESEH